MDKSWFRKLRCGAFLHWGLYAIPGGVWKGREVDYIGEWIQALLRIPNEEYSQLAREFNPVDFDADKLVSAFARAGLGYLVFTAKHHDGFCLFETQYSDYNSMNSPCHRDFVRELSEACARHGVKMGLYYSHCLDWHEKDGCDPRPVGKNMGLCSWGNDWDFPDQGEKDFGRYFQGKVLPQVQELMTHYGPISVFWADCPFPDVTAERARQLVDLVHRLQPRCLVNSRICGVEKMGDYGTLGDNEVPAGVSPEDFPSEGIITLNDTWGYKRHDHHWKSVRAVEGILLDSAQAGANLLVNFGPDGQGNLPAPCWDFLEELARWHRQVGEALHGDGRNPLPQTLSWCRLLGRGRTLWIFPTGKAGDSASLSGVEGELASCTVPVERLPNGDWRLSGLEELAEKNLPAVMTFREEPRYDHRLRLQNGILTLAASQGRLFHGERERKAGEGAFVGPAGETMGDAGHSFMTPMGLRNWGNPQDSIQWTCLLPAGKYQIRLLTRQMWHRKPWESQRKVRLEVEGQCWETLLRPDQREAENLYYQGNYSRLASLELPRNQEVTIKLATREEPEPQAEIRLEALEIRRE